MIVKNICDMHCHVREGDMFYRVIEASTKNRDYLVAMPNLKKPITDCRSMVQYYDIEYATPVIPCKILKTLYLIKDLTWQELTKCQDKGLFALKVYPRNMTTNSIYGLNPEDYTSDWFYRILEFCEQRSLPVLFHPEFPGTSCLHSEKAFIHLMYNIFHQFPKLQITLEHITSWQTVDFIKEARMMGYNIAATITAHHLYLTIDDVIGRPINTCKPVAKEAIDRAFLLEAINHEGFFLGSDSAPHHIDAKYVDCCAFGCYTAPYLIEYIAHILYKNKMINLFEQFTRKRALHFYGLNDVDTGERIELNFESRTKIPKKEQLILEPFMAEEVFNVQVRSIRI